MLIYFAQGFDGEKYPVPGTRKRGASSAESALRIRTGEVRSGASALKAHALVEAGGVASVIMARGLRRKFAKSESGWYSEVRLRPFMHRGGAFYFS